MWFTTTLFLTGISSFKMLKSSHFLPLKSKSPPLDCPFWIRCSPPLPSNILFSAIFISEISIFVETCFTLQGAVPKLSWSCFVSENLLFFGDPFQKKISHARIVANFRWIRIQFEFSLEVDVEFSPGRSKPIYSCVLSVKYMATCGCFLKWWYPQNTPKIPQNDQV